MGTPRFTIFTPTYNAERFFHRPYESVRDLASRDFEWIVVDDASTDGTVALVRRLVADLGIEVRIIEKRENLGLFDSFARVLEVARGEFLVGAAHDDRFDADTLDFVRDAWEAIPAPERASFAGIATACRSQDGKIARLFPRDAMDSDYLEMYFRYRYRFETWPIVRTQVLREFPFPADKRVGEGAFVWFPMARKYRFRYFNRALRTYYVDNPAALSGTRDFRRNAHEHAEANLRMMDFALSYPLRGLPTALACAARHVRFSAYAGRSPLRTVAGMRGASRALGVLALPAAAAMLAGDAARGRVPPPSS